MKDCNEYIKKIKTIYNTMSLILSRLALYILLSSLLVSYGLRQCFDEIRYRRFYKVKTCHRSTASLISLANFRTLERCISYARERNGLAINYSPPEVANVRRKNSREYFANCQVLGCPEVSYSSLVNDTTYDYYSIYGNLSLLEDSFCVRSVGLFRLFNDKENYTNAIVNCQNIGGDLAHILNEIRTNSLSTLISNNINTWYKAAYVGLDDTIREGTFLTPLRQPLTCFKFRAWSPGHPRSKRRNEDCVVLDSDRSWKVVDCQLKLPYLCEIYPMATTVSRNVNCSEISNRRAREKCQNSVRSKSDHRCNE